jgi:hypothetical protein
MYSLFTRISAALIFLFTFAAYANGTIQIDGIELDYEVSDYGWITSASGEAGKLTHASASKTWNLYYQSVDDKHVLPDSIETSVKTDAEKKCQELGKNELQKQKIDQDGWVTKQQSIRIAAGDTHKFDNYLGGSFTCEIYIEYGRK